MKWRVSPRFSCHLRWMKIVAVCYTKYSHEFLTQIKQSTHIFLEQLAEIQSHEIWAYHPFPSSAWRAVAAQLLTLTLIQQSHTVVSHHHDILPAALDWSCHVVFILVF